MHSTGLASGFAQLATRYFAEKSCVLKSNPRHSPERVATGKSEGPGTGTGPPAAVNVIVAEVAEVAGVAEVIPLPVLN
jgi:hypothetical protein